MRVCSFDILDTLEAYVFWVNNFRLSRWISRFARSISGSDREHNETCEVESKKNQSEM